MTAVFVDCLTGKDANKITTVVATPGHGPDRPQEVAYTDTKVIGNGSFGVVYQAKLCDSGELVAIKKVLQDKRFKVSHHQLCFTCNKGSLLLVLLGMLNEVQIFERWFWN